MYVVGIFLLFYQRLKLKKFDILVVYGELLRDCFLAELLSAKAANNLLSGSRSCSSGLHHLWESGQGPQPQYKDCLKRMRPGSLSKAAVFFLPVLFTGLLKQTCVFLSLDWLFIGLLSPSCFRLTCLITFLLKSLKSPETTNNW